MSQVPQTSSQKQSISYKNSELPESRWERNLFANKHLFQVLLAPAVFLQAFHNSPAAIKTVSKVKNKLHDPGQQSCRMPHNSYCFLLSCQGLISRENMVFRGFKWYSSRSFNRCLNCFFFCSFNGFN